jgi:SAM-dependent methyltransferase
MELTQVKFWENYWANCSLPSLADENLSFDRCLGSAIKKNLPITSGEVLEVGCAPGKWLAFMAREFGLKPSGVEYSDAGMKATLENFRILGLTPDAIFTGDFFEMKPPRQFDAVMSFGFIEHFSDVDSVVERHLQWLKPGGVLILGIPNFTGIYSPIQHVLDKDILEKHNLGIMNLDYFRGLGNRLSLEPVFLDYVGSFEPALFFANYRVGNPLQVMVRAGLWIARQIRRLRWFDRFNHPSYSGYILAIHRKSISR